MIEETLEVGLDTALVNKAVLDEARNDYVDGESKQCNRVILETRGAVKGADVSGCVRM